MSRSLDPGPSPDEAPGVVVALSDDDEDEVIIDDDDEKSLPVSKPKKDKKDKSLKKQAKEAKLATAKANAKLYSKTMQGAAVPDVVVFDNKDNVEKTVQKLIKKKKKDKKKKKKGGSSSSSDSAPVEPRVRLLSQHPQVDAAAIARKKLENDILDSWKRLPEGGAPKPMVVDEGVRTILCYSTNRMV